MILVLNLFFVALFVALFMYWVLRFFDRDEHVEYDWEAIEADLGKKPTINLNKYRKKGGSRR